MKKYLLAFLFFIISLNAQVVYEPVESEVYNFVERLSLKGIVDFNYVIKPVSRLELYNRLLEAEKKRSSLTKLEDEELDYYLKDYSLEADLSIETNSAKVSYLFNDFFNRGRLFSYSDNSFKLNLDPIQSYNVNYTGKNKSTIYSTGFNLYGYIKNNLGFSFYLKDYTESGESANNLFPFSEKTGVILSVAGKNNISYSDFRTTLTANWSWGRVTAGKDAMEWGYGKSGNLVLSQKAPSFPLIRLDIFPVDWLRFNYFHGWLNSSMIDSTLSYPSLRANPDIQREIIKEKYIASHTLSVFPMKGLEIALGESIIYGDKLKAVYFFPLMFFRATDHYNSNYNNDAGDNSQFFFQVSSKGHLKNTHLYGTLFIDEIRLAGLFNKDERKNQSGLTIGASESDLLVENLSISAEYTRINPFVYEHYIPTLTYENHSYSMGHWIGSNADILYLSLNYRILRGLELTGWMKYIRKGETGTADEQHTLPQKGFLSGNVDKYFYNGFEIKYQLFHTLFFRGEYRFSDVIYENNKRKETSLTFSIGYGL
jgi:hypothetical protein